MRLSPSRREAVEGFLYISPWIAGFLIFVFGPMAASLYLSLTHYNVLKPPEFIGLANYVTAFSHDRLFYVALQRTTYYAVAAVMLGVIGSLLLAVLLNQRLKGTVGFRTMLFLPSLTPIVASALLWGWIFHPQLGLINSGLHLIGIQGP